MTYFYFTVYVDHGSGTPTLQIQYNQNAATTNTRSWWDVLYFRKSSERLLKLSESFKICNFSAISTCNTSKKRILHIEFNLKPK